VRTKYRNDVSSSGSATERSSASPFSLNVCRSGKSSIFTVRSRRPSFWSLWNRSDERVRVSIQLSNMSSTR
jgi:hypothetical protein